MHCKNIRRFYVKITGNHLPVHFPLFFVQAPVNIFRNQAQNGSKGHYCFFVIQSYKGIFEYCRLTKPYHILISKNILQVNARKNDGKRTSSQMPGILP